LAGTRRRKSKKEKTESIRNCYHFRGNEQTKNDKFIFEEDNSNGKS